MFYIVIYGHTNRNKLAINATFFKKNPKNK